MYNTKLKVKRQTDKHGTWIYEYYGVWRYADIISVRRVSDTFHSVDNLNTLENA